MTQSEAAESIGKEFKPLITGAPFDIIRSVAADGTITGDFIESHCNDCRLKMEQPEHLKKHV